MKYLLALDGGGTRTIAYIADREGNIIHKVISGALNINGQEESTISNTVSEIVNKILDYGYHIEKCEGIGIGMAGISNVDARYLIIQLFKKAGFLCEIFLFGDHQTALAAAFPEEEGIILVSGTGSICFGQDKAKNVVKAGGYGHIMGDEGSAYAIGVAILLAIARADDGRDESTVFKDLVFEKLGINSMDELIRIIYNKHQTKKDIAELASLIDKAISMNDAKAEYIERKAAEDLAELVFAVKNRLPEVQNLAFSGSVLIKNKRIRSMVEHIVKKKYPEMFIYNGEPDAAKGALLLLLKEIQI